MVCHHPDKRHGDMRHGDNGDIRFLICYMALTDHMFMGLCEFTVSHHIAVCGGHSSNVSGILFVT